MLNLSFHIVLAVGDTDLRHCLLPEPLISNYKTPNFILSCSLFSKVVSLTVHASQRFPLSSYFPPIA